MNISHVSCMHLVRFCNINSFKSTIQLYDSIYTCDILLRRKFQIYWVGQKAKIAFSFFSNRCNQLYFKQQIYCAIRYLIVQIVSRKGNEEITISLTILFIRRQSQNFSPYFAIFEKEKNAMQAHKKLSDMMKKLLNYSGQNWFAKLHY